VSDNIRVCQSEIDCVTLSRHSDTAVNPVRADLKELHQACERAMHEVLALQEVALRIADVPVPPGDSELTIQNIRQNALSVHNIISHIESQVLSLQSAYHTSDDAVMNNDTVDVGAQVEVVCSNSSDSPVRNIRSVGGPDEPVCSAKSSLYQMSVASEKILGEHNYHLMSAAKAIRKFEMLRYAFDSNAAKLKLSQQKCRRLKTRVSSLSEKLKSASRQSDDATECIKASFSEPVQALLLRQLTKCKKHVTVEYPPELRMLALTLRSYSKPAYLFVRKMFNNKLPHPKTLAKWEHCIDSRPGLQDEDLEFQDENATVL